MWESIRAVWRAWSIFIIGLAVIFGGIYLGGRLSLSTNPVPATSSDQASSSDQGRDRGKPVVAATVTTPPSPQGGSAKQPAQQAAQSTPAPSQSPAHQENSAPAPKPFANAAAPSPPATPSSPDHDHMAASSTSTPSATTGQSPAPPASTAAPAVSKCNADHGRIDGDAARAVWSTGNARPAIPWNPARTCSARRWPASSAGRRVPRPVTIIRLR